MQVNLHLILFILQTVGLTDAHNVHNTKYDREKHHKTQIKSQIYYCKCTIQNNLSTVKNKPQLCAQHPSYRDANQKGG